MHAVVSELVIVLHNGSLSVHHKEKLGNLHFTVFNGIGNEPMFKGNHEWSEVPEGVNEAHKSLGY